MACEYYVGGKWVSENDFKEILNNGLLDNLIVNNNLSINGFKVDDDKVQQTSTQTITRTTIPAPKLKEILEQEVKSQSGYPLNMLASLELNEAKTDFKIPLWASPYAKKFESLLTSIVSNKVVKQKLAGGSYVLGSPEGFKLKEGDEAAGDLKNSNIVFSPNFDASKGLQPMRYDEATGKILPAQIMLPFKFRDEKGNILKATDFVGEDGLLDFNKFPPHLLQLFGFRIPTQERNSMAAVEIVGFLPEASGDLLLAPRDWTKQMGSDFDVDKLYTYMYNHFYKDGKLHTTFKSNKEEIQKAIEVEKENLKDLKLELKLTAEEDKIIDRFIAREDESEDNGFSTILEMLGKRATTQVVQDLENSIVELSILNRSYKASQQNKLLDIHLKVMTSNNPEVIASIIALDSFGEFSGLAEQVYKVRLEQGLVERTTTILSDIYQRTKYLNATMGKSGVGSFSLDSTFNAVSQGKDLVYLNLSEEATKELFGTFSKPKAPTSQQILELNTPLVTFGDNVSKGDMSNMHTLRSQKIIAEAKKQNRELTKEEKQSLKFKSTIIRALQSTAVDNEKEQILDKLNINDETFDAIRALTILGFEEQEIAGLLTQEIIWEYTYKLRDSRSSLSGYTENVEEVIFQELQSKYDPTDRLSTAEPEVIEKLSNVSGEKLMSNISNNKLKVLNNKKKIVNKKYDVDKTTILNRLNNTKIGEFFTLFLNDNIPTSYTKTSEDSFEGIEITKEQENQFLNSEEFVFGDKTLEELIKENGVKVEYSKEDLINKYFDKSTKFEKTSDFNLEQLLLVRKFQKLTEIGKNIKQIQSAINSGNKGVPKSLLETSAKVTQVENLPNSNVFNADKLLGEYKNGQLVKPTTINGFASLYGTMMADTIYQTYFPYKKEGLNMLFNEIMQHTARGADISMSAQTTFKDETFKDVRAFLFANEDTNLFIGNPETERERLFRDFENADSTINQSLATILQELQEKDWYQKNSFLNKLTPTPTKDGGISRVNFEASTGENFDERDIYDGFVYLLSKELPIGVFNGTQYTTRTLAQELVTAAFLEGGNQGAKQYLKYVPIAYLKSLGLGDYLKSIDFNFSETFKGITTEEGSVYTSPSLFTVQYFQNNPDKAKTVRLQDIEGNHSVLPKTFVLKQEALSQNFVEITDPLTEEPTKTQTQFLSIGDNKTDNDYALYQFDTVDRVYKQLPVTSGKYGFVSYNSQASIPKIVQITAPGYTATNQEVQPTKDPSADVVNNIAVEFTKDLPINKSLKGKEAVNNLINALEDSEDISNTNRQLLQLLRTLPLPKDFKLVYDDKLPAMGNQDYNTHTLTLNLNHSEHLTVNGLATTVAHELIHTVTGYAIKAYESGNLTNLTEKQIQVIQNLDNLRQQYIKHLTYIDKGEEARLAFNEAYKAWKLDPENSDKTFFNDTAKYYGAMKLTEFVTMALTDTKFQKILNEVTDKSGLSIWEQLKNTILDLLNSLGLDIKKDSLLASAIKNSMELIMTNEPITKSDLSTILKQYGTLNTDELLPSYREEVLKLSKEERQNALTKEEFVSLTEQEQRTALWQLKNCK
jgi:hypothetical protein